MDYTSVGCCALAFVLYINTLNAGFVYDDSRAILRNPDVIGARPLRQLIVSDFWGTPLMDAGSHGSWRPLCVLSYRFNYLLAGGFGAAWSYHLLNNLLHCLATWLVVKVARTLLSSAMCVFACGALFAAHPIHTEAVAGLVGRADVAACICYLLTYLFYLRHMRWRALGAHEQWLALALTLLLALAALLFKETAITALLLCGLCDVLRGYCGYVDKQRLRSLCILSAALCCLLYGRLIVLPQPRTAFASADNPIARSHSMWTRFLTLLYLPVFNFRLLLFPRTLSFDWGMAAVPRITTLWDRRNLLSCGFYAFLMRIVLANCQVLWRLHNTDAVVGIKRPPQELRKSRANRKQNARRHSTCTKTNAAHQLPYRVMETYTCRLAHKHTHAVAPETHTSRELHTHSHTCNTHCACPPAPYYYPIALGKSTASVFTATLSSRSSSNCSSSSSTTSSQTSNSSWPSSSSSSSVCTAAARHTAATLLLPHLSHRAQNACVQLLACLLLVLPFLPASNLCFYVGFVVAERVLYLPSVGYCLLIACGLSKVFAAAAATAAKTRALRLSLLLCFGLLLSVLSIRTVYRNMDWHSEETLYRSAISVNPPKALGNLGSVLSAQGRYDEAKHMLNAALAYRPNMADVHFNLGILHQNQQEYSAAVECFKRALHFRPSLAAAYLNLGISLLALGKRQEAATVLQAGARLEAAHVRDRAAHERARSTAYMQLGALYVEDEKPQEALAVYREALERLPPPYQKLEALYQRIGDVYAQLQQWTQAERYQRAALALQPKQAEAHLAYGIMLARNHSRAPEAELWFKRALQLAPTEASVSHRYAEFLSTQTRRQEAVVYYVRAAELAPYDYNLSVAAADALRLLHRFVDAERWYRKALVLRPNVAHAHANLGAILHLRGQVQSAMAAYRKALNLEPQHATTLANMAKLKTQTLATTKV